MATQLPTTTPKRLLQMRLCNLILATRPRTKVLIRLATDGPTMDASVTAN